MLLSILMHQYAIFRGPLYKILGEACFNKYVTIYVLPLAAVVCIISAIIVSISPHYFHEPLLFVTIIDIAKQAKMGLSILECFLNFLMIILLCSLCL